MVNHLNESMAMVVTVSSLVMGMGTGGWTELWG